MVGLLGSGGLELQTGEAGTGGSQRSHVFLLTQWLLYPLLIGRGSCFPWSPSCPLPQLGAASQACLLAEH